MRPMSVREQASFVIKHLDTDQILASAALIGHHLLLIPVAIKQGPSESYFTRPGQGVTPC